ISTGEVGPILMSPDSQSQFIPLSDVLCAAISHLNSKQQAVTQDSLLKHLAHKFPGVPVPSREILHNMLSSLIKERKIYHTGEGYFIVTPQTYYITPSLIRDENKWVRPEGDNQATPFPEVTVCHDLPEKDAQPSRAHCRSCQCFLESGVFTSPSVTIRAKSWKNDCKDVKGVPVAVVAVPCTEKVKVPEVTVGRPEKEKDGEK
uniref:Winged helix Storkhead-box1 domain-containing protein n=1 Tax=Petromyzon marinus TaxID=7757 RepID=S4RUJ9_PETMA